MTYRKLEKHEWDRLKPIFEVEEWILPNKELAIVSIAENNDGKIVGVMVIEFQLVANSFWNHPEYRGRLMFTGLAEVLASDISGITDRLPENACAYLMTQMENVEAMADMHGFKPMDCKVWRLEIR